MRILITGGTGLIGKAFIGEALKYKHELIVLTRTPERNSSSEKVKFVGWDGKTDQGWRHILDETDAVVNLAGANIGEKLWTSARKAVIRDSRVEAGEAIVQAFRSRTRRPKVLIQSSAVGYYGDTGEKNVDEFTPAAKDFLGRLCVDWENSTREVEEFGVRRSIIRTGLVLSRNGGALGKLLLPYKAFAGGPLGDGKQWWPWIHLQDQVQAMLFLIENDKAQGVFNLTAPQPARMAELGKVLAKVLKRPYWLPVPEFALKIVLGEMSKIVLEGQRAYPKRLIELGYSFSFTDLQPALESLFTP